MTIWRINHESCINLKSIYENKIMIYIIMHSVTETNHKYFEQNLVFLSCKMFKSLWTYIIWYVICNSSNKRQTNVYFLLKIIVKLLYMPQRCFVMKSNPLLGPLIKIKHIWWCFESHHKINVVCFVKIFTRTIIKLMTTTENW